MFPDDLQDTLRNLETKLVARIRFVLAAYVLKRIDEIKKEDESTLELSPQQRRRSISPSMGTRPQSFGGQVREYLTKKASTPRILTTLQEFSPPFRSCKDHNAHYHNTPYNPPPTHHNIIPSNTSDNVPFQLTL